MPLPVVDYLKIPEEGKPYLEGHKCSNCSSIFLGERKVCSNCSSRDQMEKIELGNKGKLYSYCIVHRSFPGIDVPYISAIVDLDNGGTLKGNLIDCEPNPDKIEFSVSPFSKVTTVSNPLPSIIVKGPIKV